MDIIIRLSGVLRWKHGTAVPEFYFSFMKRMGNEKVESGQSLPKETKIMNIYIESRWAMTLGWVLSLEQTKRTSFNDVSSFFSPLNVNRCSIVQVLKSSHFFPEQFENQLVCTDSNIILSGLHSGVVVSAADSRLNRPVLKCFLCLCGLLNRHQVFVTICQTCEMWRPV